MRYYTYILFSPSRYRYYIGQSHESPERAVHQHNSGKRICTKKGVPWQLVFFKQFRNSCDSYLLMQKLQNMKSRKYLEYFIDHLMHMEN
ncbi:MAG: GIY-YIG nuclease family protein [Bacteroidales bacterium]|nr:GIY-YIG nuclease family protein [Bacteroidales bacterium]